MNTVRPITEYKHWIPVNKGRNALGIRLTGSFISVSYYGSSFCSDRCFKKSPIFGMAPLNSSRIFPAGGVAYQFFLWGIHQSFFPVPIK